MVSGEADEKLMVESAQRDPRRFAELYAMHFDRVYAFIARRVSARADVQDLTSEVFQQALAGLGRYEWRGVPFAAWLYRIAANAVVDHHHRIARERTSSDAPGAPEEGVHETERRASVYRAVRELPTDQRRVIEMRFAEDKSVADRAGARPQRGRGEAASVPGARDATEAIGSR